MENATVKGSGILRERDNAEKDEREPQWDLRRSVECTGMDI